MLIQRLSGRSVGTAALESLAHASKVPARRRSPPWGPGPLHRTDTASRRRAAPRHHHRRRRVARQHPGGPSRGVCDDPQPVQSWICAVVVLANSGRHRCARRLVALRRTQVLVSVACADGRARGPKWLVGRIHARPPARVADPRATSGHERGDRHHAGGGAGDQQHAASPSWTRWYCAPSASLASIA